MEDTARLDVDAFDPDVDRHPTLRQTLTRILEDENIPEGPIERLEINLLASGEATYRYFRPRAEDSDGGYLPA